MRQVGSQFGSKYMQIHVLKILNWWFMLQNSLSLLLFSSLSPLPPLFLLPPSPFSLSLHLPCVTCLALTTNADGMTTSCWKGIVLRQSTRAVLFRLPGAEREELLFEMFFAAEQLNTWPTAEAVCLWSLLSAQGLSALPDCNIARRNKPG